MAAERPRIRAPGMPHSPSYVECPYIGAPARVQWRRPALDAILRGEPQATITVKTLDGRRRNAHAIVPSHQHAILGSAQVRNTDGKPDADGRQCDREGESRDVGQHAMAEIVGFLAVPLIAREVVGVRPAVVMRGRVESFAPSRCSGRGTRPEREHAVLILRSDRPLRFQCCWLREIDLEISMRRRQASRIIWPIGRSIHRAFPPGTRRLIEQAVMA
jgi:hypothetical protein